MNSPNSKWISVSYSRSLDRWVEFLLSFIEFIWLALSLPNDRVWFRKLIPTTNNNNKTTMTTQSQCHFWAHTVFIGQQNILLISHINPHFIHYETETQVQLFAQVYTSSKCENWDLSDSGLAGSRACSLGTSLQKKRRHWSKPEKGRRDEVKGIKKTMLPFLMHLLKGLLEVKVAEEDPNEGSGQQTQRGEATMASHSMEEISAQRVCPRALWWVAFMWFFITDSRF